MWESGHRAKQTSPKRPASPKRTRSYVAKENALQEQLNQLNGQMAQHKESGSRQPERQRLRNLISLSYANDVALIKPGMGDEDKDRIMDIIVREINRVMPFCIDDPSSAG